MVSRNCIERFMNTKTKDAILKFINELEIYLASKSHFTEGGKIDPFLLSANKLKDALKKDETIL